jgi:hypothetical protein
MERVFVAFDDEHLYRVSKLYCTAAALSGKSTMIGCHGCVVVEGAVFFVRGSLEVDR